MFSESPENVMLTGTTEPSLGYFNQGVSEPFDCDLAPDPPTPDPQQDQSDPDLNTTDPGQTPPDDSTAGGDSALPTDPPTEGNVEITSCLAGDEIVTIHNSGGHPISLAGYVLADERGHNVMNLDRITLGPGESLEILSGVAAVAGEAQIVGWPFEVWDDSGDTATIFGPDGAIVFQLACT